MPRAPLHNIRLQTPNPPAPPQIVGIRVMPPEYGEEVSSTPYEVDDIIVIKSVCWKRIHFCTIDCGTPCKQKRVYKSGVSVSEIRELASKIGAKLGSIGLPGVSSEIASKLSDTVTVSKEEQVERELIRLVKPNGGVTHAHWQLVERYIFTWEVKRFLRRSRPQIHVLEGHTDAFDETMLFFTQPDCPHEEEKDENWLDRLLKSLPRVIAQGRRAGIVLPATGGPDGSMTIPNVPGSYRLGDRISRDALLNPFRLTQEQASLMGEELYLRPYGGSLDSFLREISGAPEPGKGSSGARNLAWGLAIGVPIGIGVALHLAGETSTVRQRASDLADSARDRIDTFREAVERIRSTAHEGYQQEQGSAS